VNDGEPFFLQERPGFKEQKFKVIKFRSMNNKKDSDGTLLPDNLRLTSVGKLVRKTSIDELPQLINVLKGDMSLVGPRPLLFKYLPLYSKEQRRRHDVKPGITGLAQVNGRNRITWTEKFSHDVYYVDNISFILDIKILFLTLKKVLVREGINQTEDRPMLPFNGKN
jgi:lipopolysaccharide/colanic/teichoic acid biosynthesis glycosyltransferase